MVASTPIELDVIVLETEVIKSKQGIFKVFCNRSKAHAFVVLQAIKRASRSFSLNQFDI